MKWSAIVLVTLWGLTGDPADGVAARADKLRIEKTDRVGRKIGNEYFIADLSHRTIQGVEEDSGTLRGLTYKQFGVTLLRTRNRMHWAPNLQRVGAGGYKGIGTWHPVQEFREERKGETYIHRRAGYLAEYPEMKIEAEYRFFAGVPYFLFWIEFPFPDEEHRRRIWHITFPREAPLGDDVDFDLLAREVKLAGGNIKNIGLAAAFYAASDGGMIGMPHLLQSTRREFQKMGRTWGNPQWSDQ